jgi:hypothetical protein
MDALPVPHTPAANAALNHAVDFPALGEEEIPLGWECANPALQIAQWGVEDE